MTDSPSPRNTLERALTRLDEALTRANVGHFLQPAETAEMREVVAELRSHGLEPSKHLTDYYALANPIDVVITPWIYGNLELIPARFLAEGHRDIALDDAGRLKAGWRGHWIIIARAGSDPYAVDASKPDLPVFTDTHGVGAWQPKQVASSLAGFIDSCARWVDLFVAPGLSPEPESYRDHEDDRGERASRAAWRTFMADLNARDPRATTDSFWPDRT